MAWMPGGSLPLQMIEKPMNAVLRSDPATLNRLAEFSGRSVDLDVEDLRLQMRLRIQADGVQVRAPDEAPGDCCLRAGSVVFMQLAMRPGDRSLLFGQRMQVAGDTDLASDIADALSDLQVDSGALFAPLLGDVAAQGVGGFLDQAFGWLQRSGRHLWMDMEEYLENESGLPQRAEAQALFSRIADTRDDVERLGQRIARLRAQLDGPAGADS